MTTGRRGPGHPERPRSSRAMGHSHSPGPRPGPDESVSGSRETSNATRAKRIFGEALERPASERARHVSDACFGNSDLQRRVERLLAAHASAGDFLEEPAFEPRSRITRASEASPAAPTRSMPVLDPAPGSHLGPYRLDEVLGEGGFGVVYLAEQEQPVRRRVAVKVLKPGMDSASIVGRFEAERQALAMMDHPGIAKVFDAGATPSGRPFFVMEFVGGETITDFCDRRSFHLKQRLELFHDVCLAVQHAHQKGVIHRDLKPSNVVVSVVDGRPRPKVIDFGIAKATGLRLTDRTVVTGHFLGTPEYMSPEQASSAEDIDTRTDVYSLGVLLYELLAGASPYDRERLKSAGLVEAARMICEEDAMRPSTRFEALAGKGVEVAQRRGTTPARLAHALRSDLDWIAMRAMEKDRTRRYPTAYALADDVQRFLDDEPVSVGPPSLRYRGAKFLRRHRLAALALSAILAVILVATIVSTSAAVLTLKARSEAGALEERAAGLQRLAERRLYVANLQAAELAFTTDDSINALSYLESAPAHLRNWEWRHLRALVDRSETLYDPLGERPLRVASSPDRNLVVASYSDATLRVVDPVSGQEQARLEGLPAPCSALAFLDGTDSLASADESGTLLIWNLAQRERTKTLRLHSQTVSTLSAAAGKLVSAGEDGRVGVWDGESGELISEFTFEHPVGRAVIDPEGRLVAAALWDQTLRILDLEQQRELFRLRCARPGTTLEPPQRFAQGQVSACAFGPTDGRLYVGTRDGRLSVWDPRRGELLFAHDHELLVRGIALSPDGSRLAACSWAGYITLWSLPDMVLLGELRNHTTDVRSVQFSPDSAWLLSSSFDTTLRLWQAADGTAVASLRGHGGAVFGAHFSADGRTLVSHSSDATLRTWSLARCGLDALSPSTSKIHGVAFLSETRLASLSHTGEVRVWDVEGRRKLVEMQVDGYFSRLALDPSGEHALLAGDDGSAAYVDTARGVLLTRFSTGMDYITGVVFSRDGRRAFLADSIGGLVAWRTDGSENPRAWDSGEREIRSLVLSADGRELFVGGRSAIRALNVATGEPVRTLVEDPPAQLRSMALHPDGDLLAVGYSDRYVRLYELGAAPVRARHELSGHAGGVTRLSWLPDGSRLISSSEDGTVRLWDHETGDNVGILRCGASVHGLAVSPSGRVIASGSHDAIVRLWAEGQVDQEDRESASDR